MSIEDEIIKMVKKATVHSNYSTGKHNLRSKKLINLLTERFIFLSLDGEKMSKTKVIVKIQNLVTDNIIEESGYIDEHKINPTTFAGDVVRNFTIKEAK